MKKIQGLSACQKTPFLKSKRGFDRLPSAYANGFFLFMGDKKDIFAFFVWA